MTLSTRSYAAALKNRIQKLIARNEVDNYNLKSASDNTVEGGDIRSGLQLSEHGLVKFSVTNN